MPTHLTVGIDEAGRGCVIGPLTIAVVAADVADRRWFWAHNVRDSKLVPAAQRDELAKKIRQRCWFQIRVINPPDIDAAVRDRSRTLNGLELEVMADHLRDVMDEFPDHVRLALVDAPSTNAQGFLERLYVRSGWDDMDRLQAKHAADRRDRTVAAASILAKAERERLIRVIKNELGIDFGCGYAHDERTRKFLMTCPRGLASVRWSWNSVHTVQPP